MRRKAGGENSIEKRDGSTKNLYLKSEESHL